MTRISASLCLLLLGATLARADAIPNANAPARGAKPQAAPGDLGMAIMSARVQSDGTLVGGEGAVYAMKLGGFSGAYEVGFGRDVTQCTYVASTTLSGSAFTQPRTGAPAAVFIQTITTGASAGDIPFTLIVYCGR